MARSKPLAAILALLASVGCAIAFEGRTVGSQDARIERDKAQVELVKALAAVIQAQKLPPPLPTGTQDVCITTGEGGEDYVTCYFSGVKVIRAATPIPTPRVCLDADGVTAIPCPTPTPEVR